MNLSGEKNIKQVKVGTVNGNNVETSSKIMLSSLANGLSPGKVNNAVFSFFFLPLSVYATTYTSVLQAILS